METRANYVLVGSIVLGTIAVLIAFVFWLARIEFSSDSDTYYTYFSGSVSGLQTGSAVRYRGIQVGSVSAVEIDRANVEKIRVTLKVQPGTPVKTDSVASLEMAGITGGSVVEITGGTQSSPPLTAPGDQIPVIPSKNSTLASLVESAPRLMSSLLEVADRLKTMFSADNVQTLTDTLNNLKSISGDVAGATPQAKETIASLNKLVADLRTEIPRLVDTLQADGQSIRETADQYRQVAHNINSLIDENRGPVRDFAENGLYELTSLVTELRGLTDTLTRVADRLDQDPQRYLFGGGARTGINPNRPINEGVSPGATR